MIKLTLSPQTQPITYVFEKNDVIIGKHSAEEAPPDLALYCDGVEGIHVKIEHIGGQFIAFNIAEDPFATINDLPFSKKVIYSGDTFQIAGMILYFEAYYQEEKIEATSSEDDFLITMLDNKIQETHLDSFEIDRAMEDLENQLFIPLSENEFTRGTEPHRTNSPSRVSSKIFFAEDELDALLLQVAELEEQSIYLLEENQKLTVQPPKPEQPESHPEQPEINPLQPEIKPDQPEIKPELPEVKPEQPEIKPEQSASKTIELTASDQPELSQHRRSMKDDIPVETEEDACKKANQSSPPQSVSINSKALITAIGALILLFCIVFGCFYLAVIGQNEEKEIKAAQAVADVAMALNYAQINQAKAQNQNWSSPEFLKQNLAGVLAPPYAPLAEVDAHGQLLSTSYILRIYTGSEDLKHFLIIAQPSPGLMQWLVPKAAITVDSSFMELRKITDLKTLNRFLVNATLDTSNSADIANFVSSGELIPLVELKKYHPHTGFDSPKNLSQIHPGAENLIYNGARYYPLGEALIRKAIANYESEDNIRNAPLLVDEINRLTRFPYLVLYSSDGIQTAQRGQEAFAAFFPQYKFLHAYIQFNSQNFATSSLLLIDEESEELNIQNEVPEEPQLTELEAQNQKEIAVMDQDYQIEAAPLEDPSNINEFYLDEISRLTSSLNNKEKHTKPVASPVTGKEIDRYHPLYYKLKTLAHTREKYLKIINDEIDQEWGNSYNVARLRETYNLTVDDQQNKIVKGISALQKEYTTMPLTKFMTYVRAAGLRPFIQENLRRKLHDINHAPFPEESMNTSIEKIRRSTSLQDLEKHLQETSLLLNLENFPDTALFITYQNEIRSTVMHKLDTFLHSGSSLQTFFQPENRATIVNIFKRAWVTDKEEIKDYLKEFDLLVTQQLPST